MTSAAFAGAAPTVSVVMPSLQQARFLRAAIDSVLAQDWEPLELLVLDGGSNDGSVEILRKYGDRLSFVSEPDRGQSEAINRGLRLARGEIVAWLNSDDRYLPGAVRKAVAALDAHPDAGMAYGHGQIIDETGAQVWPYDANRPFDLWSLVWAANYVMQPTVFLRRGRVLEAGGLDEDLHYGMDWDLWVRMACRWPVVHVPEVLAQTREHAATKTAQGGWPRLRELRAIQARHGALGLTPATVVYGLDTLRKGWPAVFGPSTRAQALAQRDRLWPALCKPLHWAVASVIGTTLARAQGVDDAGWSRRRARFAVPWRGQAGRVEAIVEVPRSTVLRIECARRHAALRCARPGGYELGVDVAAAGGPPRALPVTLSSPWRSFRVRRVAFRAS